MKKYLFIVLLFEVCFPQLDPGEIIWEENFDNLNNWIIETGNGSWGWGNGELQYYKSENIEIVWVADRKENQVEAKAIHLHPRDVGGAILSLDSMEPYDSWLWAGNDWKKKVNEQVISFLNGVHILFKDPEEGMKKWERALGKKGTFKENHHQIELLNSRIIFKEDKDGRGDGPESFELRVKDKKALMSSAKRELEMRKHKIETMAFMGSAVA